MNVPNSDIDIRPMLSNLQFYIGQTGKTDHDPLLDFSLLYEHAELGVRFTLSGLDRINNPYSDKTNYIWWFFCMIKSEVLVLIYVIFGH